MGRGCGRSGGWVLRWDRDGGSFKLRQEGIYFTLQTRNPSSIILQVNFIPSLLPSL